MQVDAVVTDIDGVLVDTSESYHRAIVDAVDVVYGETIERADTQAFKNAGGFNNDWRVTEAAALWVLARREGYEEDIDAYTDAIAATGGGLDAATSVLRQALPDETWKKVRQAWEPTELRRVFQWLYLGPERYHELEADPPPQHRPEAGGYIADEPILIADDTRDFLVGTYPLGVLTGRPRQEATIALERLRLSPPAEWVLTMDDWTGGKPDPAGLMNIASAMGADRVLYVGDELDDVETARNADTTDETRTYLGVGVLTGGLSGQAGRQKFQNVGADAVLDSINALPALLAGEG